MGGRLTTVLFADVSESTRLYESAGDVAAHEAIRGWLATMRERVESGGGRVIKTIGDAMLALFPSPDTAARAASDMQALTDGLAPVAGQKIGVCIAFHTGAVIQSEDDVYGDTVNLTARLLDQAVKGQVVTSRETIERLSPGLRSLTRSLYTIQVKGKADEIELHELLWRNGPDITAHPVERPSPRAKAMVLHLKYRDRQLMRRREHELVVIGRDETCALVVADPMASRRHCSIERRHDRFVLKDHSTNGTYVTLAGDNELLLRREEVTLRRHGWISCGQPRAGSDDLIEFFCY